MIKRRPIRAVAFDLDGVLLDTETINVRAAFDGFAAFGYPLDDTDAREIVGRHPVDYVPVLAGRRGVPEPLLESIIRRQNSTYFRLWREESRMLPGSLEALDLCRERGLPVALATSSGRANVEEALDRFGLRGYFEITLTKDDVTARKPDPEIYTCAADRLRVAPEELLVIEDSAHGVRSAKRAGTICVAVSSPVVPIPESSEADYRIATLEGFPALLRRLSG